MNSKKRQERRRKAWIAERRNKPHTAYNGTDCPIANLVLELKSVPDTRKQPRLRKPIMSDGSVTARG
ncbi:hypothetical protein NVI2019_OHEONHNH_01912 [Providencia alcalifaciens]|nr:hypothetical protein NVI2019_PLFLNFOB_01409 [Providencia alcalifaciens]CAG9420485.1 hypothetical protein NVI2019_OHEONHNH_01912 [Providencia alcalifaciens]CAG9424490.1 hypothetical protein NVI2019_KOLGMIGM_02408 [Providencia alcalifaciens]CAG9425504.1 hypothetical protein NVI2019_OGMBKCAO_02408 [Providencia alcalifaciens]CAG9425784.1 hypothetical protein NVI2019_ANGEOOBF_02407 [Providencia alcalifaciens]